MLRRGYSDLDYTGLLKMDFPKKKNLWQSLRSINFAIEENC